MICNGVLRSVMLHSTSSVGKIAKEAILLSGTTSCLQERAVFGSPSNPLFRMSWRTMMTDMSGAACQKAGSVFKVLPEKQNDGGGWKSEDGKLSFGCSSFRGKRASMEDFYDVRTTKIDGQPICFFGIFDGCYSIFDESDKKGTEKVLDLVELHACHCHLTSGHGGPRAAKYLKEHLFENLMKHPEFMTNTKLAISEAYKQTDNEFLEAETDVYRDDGSTASTAVLIGNHLYVANVGDSRTVISKSGRALALSEDHKPNRSDERKRIESAGGVVMWAGTWRVGGVLAMSRAFGNRMLKQFVVADPEIQDLEVDREFELLVLASDGLWDVVPNEDAVSLALAEEEAEVAAQMLAKTAFSRGSADNITCIVVRFNHSKSEMTSLPTTSSHPVSAPKDNSSDSSVPQHHI